MEHPPRNDGDTWKDEPDSLYHTVKTGGEGGQDPLGQKHSEMRFPKSKKKCVVSSAETSNALILQSQFFGVVVRGEGFKSSPKAAVLPPPYSVTSAPKHLQSCADSDCAAPLRPRPSNVREVGEGSNGVVISG